MLVRRPTRKAEKQIRYSKIHRQTDTFPNLIVLNKGVSNIHTSGFQESENHATAQHKLVDLEREEERKRRENNKGIKENTMRGDKVMNKVREEWDNIICNL